MPPALCRISNVWPHMKRRLSPQEKKILAYVKDKMEVYAESRSKANKAVGRRKQLANSSFRMAQKLAMAGANAESGELDVISLAVESVSRETGAAGWRKISSAPLLAYKFHQRDRVWGDQGRTSTGEIGRPGRLAGRARSKAESRSELKLRRTGRLR